MGIFDRIQSEVEAREKQEGITLAELLDLSPSLRRLMNRITREGGLTVTAAAEHLEESPANTQKMLDRLVEKGYLEREKREEGWVYRTRFARKRGRDMPVGIWSALGERTGERKDSQE
jgi:DNA-binding MarR family transcriptional regulator